jgi:hypothetical protein
VSAIAAHIKAARERGPKAGLKAYLAATSPLARERQADIRSADDKLVRYCEIFGEQIGLNASAPATAARVEHDEDATESSLYQRFLRFIASEGEDVSDVPGATIQVVADEPTPAPRKRTSRKPATGVRSPLSKGDTVFYTVKDGSRTIELTVVGFGPTKNNHPGTILRNSNTQRDKAWSNAQIKRLLKNDRLDVL